jgi:hypothetical protein
VRDDSTRDAQTVPRKPRRRWLRTTLYTAYLVVFVELTLQVFYT